jgi:TrmH family RNA methyltransferase
MLMLSKNEVKYIQSLSHQKERDELSAFVAEGVKIVDDLIAQCPDQIKLIYATEEYFNRVKARNQQIQCKLINDDDLKRISQLQTPNQVLAVVNQFNVIHPDLDYKGWIIGLDGIQDPGNMGTIIRLADWFGVKHILCSLDCVDLYNAKVVQSSMGSMARVGVSYLDLEEWLRQYSGDIIGGVLGGQNLNQIQFSEYGLIVIGREGAGIRGNILKHIKRPVQIPSFGGAESLNAGVAAGIFLWEIKRVMGR